MLNFKIDKFEGPLGLLLELIDLAEHFLDAHLQVIRIHLHVLEDERGRVLAGGDEGVEQVLRAHVRVAELVRGDDALFDDGVEEG